MHDCWIAHMLKCMVGRGQPVMTFLPENSKNGRVAEWLKATEAIKTIIEYVGFRKEKKKIHTISWQNLPKDFCHCKA